MVYLPASKKLRVVWAYPLGLALSFRVLLYKKDEIDQTFKLVEKRGTPGASRKYTFAWHVRASGEKYMACIQTCCRDCSESEAECTPEFVVP